MRSNEHLIHKSDLLAAIVEKIETSYAEDISLLVCYGSYVTGGYGPVSDIDFYFVPKTERGGRLGCQFILDDIGYDLWAVSWERLAAISKLEDPLASILMDGEVLFASSQDDLRQLGELKNNLRQNLGSEAVARQMSLRSIDRAKSIYFDLRSGERNRIYINAVNIAETLLFAIAIMNGTYTRKGLKRIEAEIGRFPVSPAGYLDAYRRLIRANDTAEVQHISGELIAETHRVWKARFNSDKMNVDPSELAGFYEEFKSAYNKLLFACDEKNYENAYYAGFMIDRETQSFLSSYAGQGVFPNLIEEVLRNDFEVLHARCLEHERLLLKLLDKHGIKINVYRDINEFRGTFWGREPDRSFRYGADDDAGSRSVRADGCLHQII